MESKNLQLTSDRPILVGLLVDVSGSMTSAIENRGASQNRLESFRDALEGFVLEYAKTIEEQSKDRPSQVKLFAYGFGFGNPLASFLGRSGRVVRDLLSLSTGGVSTVDIVDLARNWPRYKSHVEGLAVEMFGSTPMKEAFQTAKQRFADESGSGQAQRILFVLSDGEPTDSTPPEIMEIADQLKESGALIVSCYVTNEDVAEPRHIYGRVPGNWSAGARLMFECASIVPKGSPFDVYLREFQWKIEDGGRLFTQINQSELLSEFMNVVLSPLRRESHNPPGRRPKSSSNLPSESAPPSDKPAPEVISPPETHQQNAAKSFNSAPERTRPNWPAWVFGGILVLFFMGVIWFKPQEQFNAQQQKLLRILASVLVGVISAFFTGSLKLEGKIPGLKDTQIGAIGGFAGFALTFFLW